VAIHREFNPALAKRVITAALFVRIFAAFRVVSWGIQPLTHLSFAALVVYM